MSEKSVHAPCVVCGELVHIGFDGEMAERPATTANERKEQVATHASCRGKKWWLDRRSHPEAGRRVPDQERYTRMGYLEDATPRARRRLLREWFGGKG